MVLGRERERWAAEVASAAARTKRLGLVQREVALCSETAASGASLEMVTHHLLPSFHASASGASFGPAPRQLPVGLFLARWSSTSRALSIEHLLGI